MDNPFDIVIYDKNMNMTGFVTDPTYCNFVPAWKQQGYGSFMVASDNPHTEALQTRGARVTVNYLGKHVMSGPIRSYQGDVLKNTADTYQVLDDKRLLENTLLFVDPFKPLTTASLTDLAQSWQKPGTEGVAGTVAGQYAYCYWPDGTVTSGGVDVTTSEGAIKWAIGANLITRLGRPVTLAADLGRGGDPRQILPAVRFAPLSEALTPIIKFSGLGISLRQYRMTKTIEVDVHVPGVWEQTLTPESGIIKSGTFSVGTPDITRPILGGPGETAARVFAGITGKGNITGREVDYNDVIEVFRDATAATLVWPDALTDSYRVAKYYAQQATAANVADLADYFAAEQETALEAGPPTSGLILELSETSTFHYGGPDGVQLGDKVTVSINGVPFTDQVTEAQMVFSRDKGLSITPLIGEKKDDPDVVLANSIAALATALRNLSTSK